MVTKPKTEAEAQAMRAALAAFVADQPAHERLKPLKVFVNSKAFKEVETKATELVDQFSGDPSIDVHLRHVPGFLQRLRAATEAASVEPMPVAAPQP